LLIFGSTHELDEVFIVFVEAIVDLVFSTGHSVVVLTLAPQAIVLPAGRTAIVVQLLLERENCSTACSWTPGRGIVIHLNKFIE
jgi:hypothetical protein